MFVGMHRKFPARDGNARQGVVEGLNRFIRHTLHRALVELHLPWLLLLGLEISIEGSPDQKVIVCSTSHVHRRVNFRSVDGISPPNRYSNEINPPLDKVRLPTVNMSGALTNVGVSESSRQKKPKLLQHFKKFAGSPLVLRGRLQIANVRRDYISDFNVKITKQQKRAPGRAAGKNLVKPAKISDLPVDGGVQPRLTFPWPQMRQMDNTNIDRANLQGQID